MHTMMDCFLIVGAFGILFVAFGLWWLSLLFDLVDPD